MIDDTPALPAGYQLQESMPPLPSGYKLQAPKLTENGREIPEGGFGIGHYLKEQMPSGSDLVHALGLPANSEEMRQRMEDEQRKSFTDRLKGNLAVVKDISLGPIPSMAKEAWRAARHPFDPMAITHAAAAANPFAAPVIDAMSEQGLGTKEANATGAVNAAMLASGEIIPKASGKVIEMAPNLSAKAGAIGKVAAQDAAAHIPIAGRLIRRPSFADYIEAAKAKADSQLALFNKTPKLGNSTMEPPPFPGTDKLTKAGQDAGLFKPSEVEAVSKKVPQPVEKTPIPTLEERAAKGDLIAKGILKDKAAAAARENMLSPEVQAQMDATKINSPKQAQAALDQAAQDMFGKKYDDLTLEQKLKTLSEGYKIQTAEQNLTQSGNKQRRNLKKNQRELATADPALVEKYKKQ